MNLELQLHLDIRPWQICDGASVAAVDASCRCLTEWALKCALERGQCESEQAVRFIKHDGSQLQDGRSRQQQRYIHEQNFLTQQDICSVSNHISYENATQLAVPCLLERVYATCRSPKVRIPVKSAH